MEMWFYEFLTLVLAEKEWPVLLFDERTAVLIDLVDGWAP
jgi:hypothetical protein